MENEQIPLAPIAGWDVAHIAALGAVMLRIHYLTHSTQQPTEAQQTPHLVMNAAQAQELSEALKRSLEALQAGPPQGTGVQKH